MKLSIVTPSYNQGNFIEETIKSVLNQTYRDFEYIIIDGGSNDNTIDIIKKYDNDPRLRWISKKDGGQTNAINKGFKIAKGDVLAWLNSDDVYHNNHVFEKIIAEFKNDPGLDLLYGKCYYIDEKGEILGEFESKGFNYNYMLNHDCGVIPQASCFFTKRILNKVGDLDESLHYSMDYDLWLRMGKIGRVRYINDVLSQFRQHVECKTVKGVYQCRMEAWRVSRRNHGLFLSPLLFRMLYCSAKEIFHGYKRGDFENRRWYKKFSTKEGLVTK